MNTATILQLATDLAELAFDQGREYERGWHAIARVTELKRNAVMRELEAALEREPDMSNRRAER